VDVGAVHLHHVLLAGLGVEACLAVVVEEAVQASAIDVHVRRAEDAQTPGLAAGISRAVREFRVTPGRLGGEGRQSIGVRLIVSGWTVRQ